MMSLSQIRLAHRVVVHERVGAAFLDNVAGFQHVGAVGDRKAPSARSAQPAGSSCRSGVQLAGRCRKICFPRGSGARPMDGSSSVGRLGACHVERAAHGEHLLLASRGACRRSGAGALLVGAESCSIHICNAQRQRRQFRLGAYGRPSPRLSRHGHLLGSAAALRATCAGPRATTLVRGDAAGDVVALKGDQLHVLGLQKAGDGVQRGGLALRRSRRSS